MKGFAMKKLDCNSTISIKKCIKILVLLLLFTTNFSQEISLKTSVIVPCYYGHFKHIEELLHYLEKQTVLPDEVVISLSEINKVPIAQLIQLKSLSFHFPVKIIGHEEKLLAGANRNSACEIAIGDIFICNDADDIPHRQRIEIIKYFFEHYDVDMIIHNLILDPECPPVWYSSTANSYFGEYNNANIPWTLLGWYDQIYSFPYHHNGNIAIRKKVFEKLKWPNDIRVGEDDLFNRQCFDMFRKTAVLDVNLIMYRQQLSSREEVISSLGQVKR